jgi:putative ABC transport system permease protein
MSVQERIAEEHLPAPSAGMWQKGGMGAVEACWVAFQGLMANKLRSFLTMLGIIIGVSAVIVMVSLGQGAAQATQQAIQRLGTNVLQVMPNMQMVGGLSQGLGSMQTLKLTDAEVILKECPSVKAVSPEYRGNGQVKFRDQNTRTTIYGAGPDYFEIRNLPIAQGAAFTEDDMKRRAKVAVIGDNIRQTLFGSLQAVGKYIKIEGQSFKVVGVTEPRGASGFRSPDDQVTIPVTTAMNRVFGVDYLNGMSVEAVSADKMQQAQDEIMAAIAKAHKTRPDQESDIRIFNQADITESAAQQSRFLTMLLAGIALVSLIVGGIGIMNIMLVSVTERTREIGIRKAVGAKRRDILYQFLVEAMTLSVVGGLIGVAVGLGGSWWMARPASAGGLGFPMMFSLPPVLISFCSSALVGIFFGIYPAVRASGLDPIEALRYE